MADPTVADAGANEESGAPTLLLVDDDASFREALGGAMRRRGYIVYLAENGEQAIATATETSIEYAVVDIRMVGMDGVEVVRRLHAIDDGTRIVVLTGYGTIANAVDAMRAGAFDYLTKPIDAAACERALHGTKLADPADGRVPTLERVEWEYLQRVVSDCDGNISEAARRLGMHRRSLQRKLSRHAPRS